jgi:hypothetical protein
VAIVLRHVLLHKQPRLAPAAIGGEAIFTHPCSLSIENH